VNIDLDIGDIVLGGKFKNKRMKVKTIGTDDLGQPTINGRSLLKFRIEKKMPRDKWSAKSKKDSEKKMKITEKQLRNLVSQTLNESSDRSYKMTHRSAPMPVKSRASAEFVALIKGKPLKEAPRDRIKVEAGLMSDLDSIATSIEEIAEGMYGLIDPMGEDPGGGDEMAGELEMQVERLGTLYNQMVAHFESMDPENATSAPPRPGMRGSAD